MSIDSNRREFLKLAAMGVAATATAEVLPPFVRTTPSEGATGRIEVWVTDRNLRCAQTAPISWRSKSSNGSDPEVVLDLGKKFQQILGFGGAFTDAACYMFSQLSPDARARLFCEMFHPSELGLNVCRTCIGASDYSTHVYSYDEGDPDPDLKRFSIDYDVKNILPILREARQVNPDLFLFSSPWSPPGWMKSGGSMLGGSMRRRHIPAYADYFVKFLKAYAAEGVVVQAVTPQNEVDTDQDGRMPACIWPQEYEIEFVKQLGPMLQQNGLATKIWILDHNYNLWGRAIAELDDGGLREYCNAVAWHGYVGKAEMMTKVHEFHPDSEMHWTEGGPDYTSPDYGTDWAKWARTFSEVLNNWCQSITVWNLSLDEQGRPNLGPFPCGGTVTINSRTKEITRSGQFWALAHFSRFIRRGAHRISSVCGLKGLHQVAVENADGSKVVVMTNDSDARTVTLQAADKLTAICLLYTSPSPRD